MRRASFVVLIAACGSSGSKPLPTGPITATVTHYDYTFDIDSRAAHAEVTATIDTAGNCWTLPFRAQGIANVALDGVAITDVTTDATSLTACGAGYEAGPTPVL